MGYYFIHLIYVMALNLRIPVVALGEIYAYGLMHIFIIFSPIETLGSPCSSLCGLNIMITKLFDAYNIIKSRLFLVTLEYLGDI